MAHPRSRPSHPSRSRWKPSQSRIPGARSGLRTVISPWRRYRRFLSPQKSLVPKQVSATQHKVQPSVSGISPKLEPTTIAAAPELLPTAYGDRQISPETKRLMEEMTALSEKAPRENITDDRSPAREVNRKSKPFPRSPTPAIRSHRQGPRSAPPKRLIGKSWPRSAPPADPTGEVTALRDLPPETRSAIPALEVNVHTYAQIVKIAWC